MDSSLRIVIQIPLCELWNDLGVVATSKKRQLRRNEISDMLHAGRVRFVVANGGYPLNWIDPSNCFEFWKTEVKHRIVDTEKFFLDDFPDKWCFVSSEWSDDQPLPIVLLEKYH